MRLLYVESYGSGSHIKIARDIQRYSSNRIDIIRLGREHWRTLALTGHRALADAFRSLSGRSYDAILFSGPADLRLVRRHLPPNLSGLPIVTYFHESQWTYPAESLDRIPHLINHLETVEISDATWFNSRFHRDTFFTRALDHPSRAVRSLARQLLPGYWSRSRVVYPPVSIGGRPLTRADQLTITWSARWEQEKRPDLMLDIIRRCLGAGLEIRLHILGCNEERWINAPTISDDIRGVIQPVSGFVDRDAYEQALASTDIWLSTAEHEFFGLSALEAALLGAIPLVPAALAYPETLPSAFTYPPGDVLGATRRVIATASAGKAIAGPWRIDADRYRAELSVRRFDSALEDLVHNRRQ